MQLNSYTTPSQIFRHESLDHGTGSIRDIYSDGWSFPRDGTFRTYTEQRIKRRSYAQSGTLRALLAAFSSCKCLDPRDGVYALLSLATSGSLITVDYNRNVVQLFQYVLEQHMDGRSLDELVWLGVHVMKASRLRGPAEQPVALRHHSSSAFPRSENTRVRSYVGMPAWADATLEIDDHPLDPWEGDEAEWTTYTYQSMYVPVYDNNNVDVLEYAFKEHGSEITADFARCHEFLYGDPFETHETRTDAGSSAPEANLDTLNEPRWLGMPSEDVLPPHRSWAPAF